MIQIKLDPFKTPAQNVYDNIAEGDQILFEFQVVPLDYRVKDRTTPIFYITSEKIYFVYDDLMEVFDLTALEMDVLGESPKFAPWQLWFEGKYKYSDTDGDSFEQLKSSIYYPRLAFNEKNQVPKEFALRSGNIVATSYQSWAMAQIIINVKNGVSNDPRLVDLFRGDFAKYNGKTLGIFFIVFLVYTVFKSLFDQYGTVLGNIMDIAFGLVSAFMLWWMYMSIAKNLLRYKAVYDGYQMEKQNSKQSADGNSVTPATTTVNASQDNETDADETEIVEAINEIEAEFEPTDDVVETIETPQPMQSFAPVNPTNNVAPITTAPVANQSPIQNGFQNQQARQGFTQANIVQQQQIPVAPAPIAQPQTPQPTSQNAPSTQFVPPAQLNSENIQPVIQRPTPPQRPVVTPFRQPDNN